MKLYRHRNLWRVDKGLPLLIVFMVFLNSCSFGLLKGYEKAGQGSVLPVSWFNTGSEHMLMNTTIDVKKNHFSGIMVIKTLADTGYRVVFLTEVGLKIFDLEFISGKPVKVYYFMEALNKKILIRTLSSDLGLMLIQAVANEKPVVYETSSAGKIVKYKQKGERSYYEVSPATHKPFHAYRVSGISKKARIDYYSKGGMQIDSVNILHYHVNLRIGMHFINENQQDAVK